MGKGEGKRKKRDKDEDSGKKGKFAKQAKQLGIDVLTALVIVGIVMGVLYFYSGVWPPLVVVESRSMQHSNTKSMAGVIDTGDLVVVKKPSSLDDITTFAKGKGTGYATYGEYGDVIVYRKDGSMSETPVIHRAILYANYDPSSGLFNMPELQGLKYGKDWMRDGSGQSWSAISTLTLYNLGYGNKTITINFQTMRKYSGYVSMGDNAQTNPEIDQVNIIPNKLIKFDWIVGVARGELPWFGLIKLCISSSPSDKQNCDRAPQNSVQGVWVALGVLVVMPIMYDVSRTYIQRREEEREKEGYVRPSQPIAAFLNMVLPGTGYMYANLKRWGVIGAYVFTLYFFLIEVLLMYALEFPAVWLAGLFILNAIMAGHVFHLLKR